MKLIEDFDPRPSQFKGTVKANISKPLHKLDGEYLCISLLLDSRYQQECSHFNTLPITYDFPSDKTLATAIDTFREIMEVSSSKAREKERNT